MKSWSARGSWFRRLRRWSPRGVVLAAALTGVALRLLVALSFPDMRLHGDERHYFEGAEQLLGGHEVEHFPFRTPLYIFFSAAVLGLIEHSAVAIRIVQALIEGFTILGVAAIAQRAAGPRAATAAAWLTALYPEFVAYSHYLFSETLFLFLLVSGIVALQRLLSVLQGAARWLSASRGEH